MPIASGLTGIRSVLGVLVVAGAATAAAGLQAQESAAGLLDAAVAKAAEHKGDGYAFTRHLVVRGNDEHVDIVQRYDPSAPVDSRWTLVSIDGTAPDEDGESSTEVESEEDGDLPSYDNLADLDTAGAELIEQDARRAVFRLDTAASFILDDESKEFADNLVTDVTVAKTGPAAPYVSSLRIHAPAAFKPAMVAEITALETVLSYAPEPATGRLLPRELAVDLTGSALLWIDFDVKTHIAFTDYTFVGQ